MLDHRHGPHAGTDTGRGDAINVLHSQTSISDSPLRGLYQDLHLGKALGDPLPSLTYPYYGCFSAQIDAHFSSLAGVKPTIGPSSPSVIGLCTRMPMAASSALTRSSRLTMRTAPSRSISAPL